MICTRFGAVCSNIRRLLTIAGFTLIVLLSAYAGHNKGVPLESGPAPILLFNGAGTSPNDVTAVETILDSLRLSYSTINSSELNRMGRARMMKYRLLIMPGGDFIDIGKSLDTVTATNVRYAVQHGLNYLGICAGAFLAGHLARYNCLNLTSGVTFGFYSAESKGIRKAALAITSLGAPTLDQYWEDGPQLSGWGAVVAKYPDGTPAVAEGKCGSGFVLLTGFHAEAPEGWRGGMVFKTPADVDHAYTAMLIQATLQGVSLSHY